MKYDHEQNVVSGLKPNCIRTMFFRRVRRTLNHQSCECAVVENEHDITHNLGILGVMCTHAMVSSMSFLRTEFAFDHFEKRTSLRVILQGALNENVLEPQ